MEAIHDRRAVKDAAQYIIEPPDLWTKRVAQAQRDLAPKVVSMPDGGQGWSFDGGAWLRPIGLEASAGRAPAEARDHGYSYADIRKGMCDAKERVKDMDADGIDSASIFPTYGLDVRSIEDPALHVACVKAYNDGVCEWAQAGDGRRLVPHALIPAVGMDAAVAELQRVAKIGFKGIVFPGWPAGGNTPKPEEDRFWALCAEAGIVVNLVRGGVTGTDRTPAAPKKYIGPQGKRVRIAPEVSPEQALLQEISITVPKVVQAVWMINSGILDRNPKLKVSLIDTAGGWIPTMVELTDWHYRYSRYVAGWNLKGVPRDYWTTNFKWTFREEHYAVTVRHEMGVHTLMWASGYPLLDSTWPRSSNAIQNLMRDVPESETQQILGGNWAAHYGAAAKQAAAVGAR